MTKKWNFRCVIIFILASLGNFEQSTVGTHESDKINHIDRSYSRHHSNTITTMHICWHRTLSVSMNDYRRAIKHHLSGYLLRKFRNSNGWQKLWVVFTNFCLFFYKNYQVVHYNICFFSLLN